MPRRSFMMYPDNAQNGGVDNDINDIASLFDFNLKSSIFYRIIAFIWNMILNIISFIVLLISILYSMFGYYIMWISLHYVAVHLYPTYCAPLTVMGFILSPFMVSAPHCVAMRWLVVEGSNVIVTMWVAIGAYAIQRILRRPAPVPPPVPVPVPAPAPVQ